MGVAMLLKTWDRKHLMKPMVKRINQLIKIILKLFNSQIPNIYGVKCEPNPFQDNQNKFIFN